MPSSRQVIAPLTPPIDPPVYGEPAQAFLKYTIAFILTGSAAFLVTIALFAPDQTVRIAGPVAASAVAIAVWLLLVSRRTDAAIWVLALGLWGVVTGISVFNGGVRTPIVIAYPLIILMVGWLAGTRAAIAIAVLTVAATFGFVIAETWDFLPHQPPTHPAMHWVVQGVVFVFSVPLIVYVVRSYHNRNVEVQKLGGDLAQRTAEVQAREADLNHAQAIARVGSWVYELARDELHLSDETCRIFGLPRGYVGRGGGFLARVHPDDRDALVQVWRAALHGAGFDTEHRILVGDSVHWVRQRAELEFGADRKLLRAVGTTQDISERKTKEHEYQTIIEASIDGFWITDYSTRILDANAAVCRMLGYSREELLRLSILEIDADETPADVAARTREMLQSGSARFQARHRRKDGKLNDVEVSVLHVPELGERLFAFVRDITEQKRADAALRETEQRLSLTIDAAHLGTFAWDISSDRVTSNAREAELFGLTLADADATYSAFEQRVHPDDLPSFGEALAKCRRDGSLFNHEFRVVWRDGSVHWVATSGRFSYDAASGDPVRMHGVTEDITERRRAAEVHAQLEAQLRESQKMEALGTLAGGVAHDFNNIVAAILGNAELARQDAGPGNPAQASLEEIRKAGRRAKELVRQILAFGRRQVLERKVISLAPVLEESVRLLRATLPAGVNLSVECAPEAPAVLADATQVEQVVLNLCSNAWHAVQGQGRPGVIEVCLEASAEGPLDTHGKPRRRACLTVRDNGSGMNETVRPHIFDPFFTTKPAGEGTGLGLSVVHGIVQEHDASIEVTSAPGAGTTFRIFFPAAHTAPASIVPRSQYGEAGRMPQGQGRHVLYIDDDEAIVYLMQRMLERQGYRVSGHTGPHAALAAVRAEPGLFDLVVTDYNMPGMSGLELARALREIRADLPVAIASGYITEELRIQAPAAGVGELVFKPDTVDELCEVVARLAHALPN